MSQREIFFRRSELSFHDYDRLVGLAYTGAQEGVPWTRLLDELRDCLQANYVSLILRSASYPDHPMQVVFAGEARPAIVQPYESELDVIDHFVNLPRNQAVVLEELIDEESWLKGVYYQAFHEPMNMRYHMAADIGMGVESSCRLRVSRPHGAQRFGDRERAICNLLVPHLDTAVQLRASFDIAEVERHLYVGMFDRMSVGVALLHRDRRVLRLNQVATELLAKGDGLKLVDGHLMASIPSESRKLRQLIEQAVVMAGTHRVGVVSGMSLSRPSGMAALGLAVRAAALTEWSDPSNRPAAMVIIRDPEAGVLASDEQLKRLYGLTNAEAALALELMSGRTMEESANHLGVSRNTTRCQLRAIFAKTGVTRQAELLRVLLSGVAPLS